jgi:hypothetical protein
MSAQANTPPMTKIITHVNTWSIIRVPLDR